MDISNKQNFANPPRWPFIFLQTKAKSPHSVFQSWKDQNFRLQPSAWDGLSLFRRTAMPLWIQSDAVRKLFTSIGSRLLLVNSDSEEEVPEVGFDLLREAKDILKRYRNDRDFKTRSTGFLERQGIEPEEDIASCSKGKSKHLRAPYNHLFSSKRERGRISKGVHELLDDPAINWEKDLDFRQEGGLWLGQLPNKIILQAVFGLPIDDPRCAALLASDRDTEKILRLVRESRSFIETMPLWSWMQQKGYSENEKILTIAAMMSISMGNIQRALYATIGQCSISKTDWLMEARAELEDLISTGLTLWEAASKSACINRVCVEGLRINPTTKEVDREVARDMKARSRDWPKRDLKAGSPVVVSIFKLSRDEDLVGKDPKQFCPMRFKGKEIDFLPDHDFLPFGYGPHQCPAWWLYKEVAIKFLAFLCMNFEWAIDDNGFKYLVRRA